MADRKRIQFPMRGGEGNCKKAKKLRKMLPLWNDDCIVRFLVYKSCAEVYRTGHKSSGVYKVDPDGLGETDVFCDQNTAGGGWTVFQKRQDGSVDFYRGWDDYKRGFGHLNGEFWLGLDNIHRLTKSGNNKLRVDLELHKEKAFAEYSFFAVDNETDKYKLSLSGYSGNHFTQYTWLLLSA